MATCKENYTNLTSFLKAFPKYVEDKKDLLKIKDSRVLKMYYVYRSYFGIDARLKPSNVIKELKLYKERNLKFKSEELGLDLTKNKEFSISDKYKSSTKLISKVTDAMLNKGDKLVSVSTDFKEVDIRYGVKSSRKVVIFDLENNTLDFMQNLADDIYVNISQAKGGYSSSYNKNGLDFINDYHNQSNDFAENLVPFVSEGGLFIYNY